MARGFYISGESLVQVKGRGDSAIATVSQLGLSADQIHVALDSNYEDMTVEAWGHAPPDVQYMLSSAIITMNLVHFDAAVLDECLRLSMGGAPTVGTVSHAGQPLGNNKARFAVATGNPATGAAGGNNFIGLNITSPVAARPWRFLMTYLANQPMRHPLGVRRSIVSLQWRAIPYTTDPYNNGLGAYNTVLWDRTLDTDE
jgi:hypothetical protein